MINTCFVIGTTIWLSLSGGHGYGFFLNTENIVTVYDVADYAAITTSQTSTGSNINYAYDDEKQKWLTAGEIIEIMKSCKVDDNAKN